jgi:hypothetical protein
LIPVSTGVKKHLLSRSCANSKDEQLEGKNIMEAPVKGGEITHVKEAGYAKTKEFSEK